MKKTLSQEKLDYLQIYLNRQFALNPQAKTEDAKSWLKSNGLGVKSMGSAKRELVSTAGSVALLAWTDRWMSEAGIKKFEVAYRQHVFMKKKKMTTFRISTETHEKLAAYCEINKLKLSEAIDKLLAAACKGNGL